MNLKILKLSDIHSFTYQKCLLPQELFPKSALPGALAKCIDSAGSEFICNIFPMTNQKQAHFCWLDDTVKLGFMKTTKSRSLTSFEVFNSTAQPVKTVSLTVKITEKLFEIREDLDRELLATIAKHILQPFSFVNNSTIHLEELRDLGIEEINIQADELGVFSITEETTIVVTDVKLGSSEEIFQHRDLKALEAPQNELEQLVHSATAYTNLKWRVKPSPNAVVVGPPGSGKTSLVGDFIRKNNCNSYVIRSSSILGQYPGETEAELRRIFNSVTQFVWCFKPNDPMVVFIEDLDLICPSSQQNSGESGSSTRIAGQLISILDQMHESSKIIVLAATANLEAINSGLRRPGRFGIEINIPALSEEQRGDIFLTMVKESFYGDTIEIGDDILHAVSKQTQGFVVADLSLLVHTVGQNLLQTEITTERFVNTLWRSLKVMKPASSRGTDIAVYKTEEKFDSVGGMEQLKRTLEVSVLAGLRQKAAFERFGLCLPKGVLLYGPPGCAKTTIAKCLATEANMTFIPTSAAEIYSPYVGNSEKYISKIFDTARKNSPCLVFLDEIDSLVGKRTADSRSDLQTRILSTLLTEMDGIGVKLYTSTPGGHNILVVAATNRPDMIDDALMRPGRFDKLIHVPAPDLDSRDKILQIHATRMPFGSDVNKSVIASATENFSGADICNLCNEAAMHAFTRDIDAEYITMSDFDSVLSHQKSSLTQSQIHWYYEFESTHKR